MPEADGVFTLKAYEMQGERFDTFWRKTKNAYFAAMLDDINTRQRILARPDEIWKSVTRVDPRKRIHPDFIEEKGPLDDDIEFMKFLQDYFVSTPYHPADIFPIKVDGQTIGEFRRNPRSGNF